MPFLIAASKLGVPPKHCLVFEDTDLGIQCGDRGGNGLRPRPVDVRQKLRNRQPPSKRGEWSMPATVDAMNANKGTGASARDSSTAEPTA